MTTFTEKEIREYIENRYSELKAERSEAANGQRTWYQTDEDNFNQWRKLNNAIDSNRYGLSEEEKNFVAMQMTFAKMMGNL